MGEGRRESWAEALGRSSGRDYWRGLDELLETPEFREAIRREFPAGAAESAAGMSRRSFVRLLGASVTLAGIGGCTRPVEHILPYVRRPPEVAPGVPLHYATTMVLGGYATGLLVESHVGRPTKVEGNPDHPASLGAAGVHEQASILQLYDAQRARSVRHRGEPTTWAAFLQAFAASPRRPRAAAGEGGRGAGAGLRFLLEPTSSPLAGELVSRIRERQPEARFYFHSPLASPAPIEGARQALGRPLQTQFDFRAADVVLSLDSDFLASAPFHLRYARHFAERRRISAPSGSMSRLYVAEGTLTSTGAMADHRLRIRTGEVQRVAAAVLAAAAGGPGSPRAGVPAPLVPALERAQGRVVDAAWIGAVARDLQASAGRSIVIAGERQPPAVHGIAHLLNAALGNTGRTIWYTEPPILEAGEPSHDLGALVAEMRAGEVETLVILEGNPSYAAPADLEFSRWLRQLPNTVYLGLYENETARDCAWSIPAAHFLESWGDARAYDGTISFIQPLIAPLWGGRTPAELLAVFLGGGEGGREGGGAQSAHALLREYWSGRLGGAESAWEEVLQRGVLAGSEAPRVAAVPRWESLALLIPDAGAEGGVAASGTGGADGLEVVFRQDPRLYDGRFANNAWLQELPDPMTKLVWDNAALLSPATAARLDVEAGDMLRLRYRGRELRIPAFVLPGHADESVSLHFGYGREGAESVARGVGFDVYRIWTTGAPYFDTGLEVERLGEEHLLVTTQAHWAMPGRPIVLSATLEEYRRHPDFTKEHRAPTLSLYRPYEYAAGNQWTMAIDLSICAGCSACVVACQAENNVPVVGKAEVRNSREMHWLRIDRYFTGTAEDPGVALQPMLCQHCERAPCEYVCPVNATVHSPDGLNEMVYNRCVGTRFCSNNCPYKVRRFNWFGYTERLTETEEMAMNPDVTVRARGVMEKCTFCVQRIRQAEIAARLEGRSVRPGEVRTACQQACPTRAIVFGSSTDPDEELRRRLADPRRYVVLHELGTEPRVKYLARITNPNPELDRAGAPRELPDA